MSTPLQVLVVEDSAEDTELLLGELRRGGYDPMHERVQTADALRAVLDSQPWDIVLSDYSMPGFNGVAALRLVRDKGLDIPFLFVSGTIGEDTAVEAMKAGANDYIMKDHLKRLLPAVKRELREAKFRSAHKDLQGLIDHMVYYDPVTTLPNRNQFYDRLAEMIDDRSAHTESFAIVLIDVNRFKGINDTIGLHRGDLLLRQVGTRLRALLAASHLIARLDGGTFVVLLSSVAVPADISIIAQEILNGFETPFRVEGLTIRVKASLGIAFYPDHGTDPESLLGRANVALSASKNSGRYVVYAEGQDHSIFSSVSVLGELEDAIEQNHLCLDYQPKVELSTRRVIGVEALVRWRHPLHGIIPPNQFIVPAEQTGLIKPLTQWVLTTALFQAERWRLAGYPLRMAVNLSSCLLHDRELANQIEALLKAHHLPPSALILEITESAIVADPGRAKHTLGFLRGIGVSLSLDDFGTGQSSLSYLKDFPMDEIKIDRSFTHECGTTRSGVAMVRAIVELAHSFGLSVVAEGVEDEEVWHRLATLGCDAAQGYYISHPLPPEMVPRWLTESSWKPAGQPATGRDRLTGAGNPDAN
jgi:diguanylate cyclase (GGDEF)-like protein